MIQVRVQWPMDEMFFEIEETKEMKKKHSSVDRIENECKLLLLWNGIEKEKKDQASQSIAKQMLFNKTDWHFKYIILSFCWLLYTVANYAFYNVIKKNNFWNVQSENAYTKTAVCSWQWFMCASTVTWAPRRKPRNDSLFYKLRCLHIYGSCLHKTLSIVENWHR